MLNNIEDIRDRWGSVIKEATKKERNAIQKAKKELRDVYKALAKDIISNAMFSIKEIDEDSVTLQLKFKVISLCSVDTDLLVNVINNYMSSFFKEEFNSTVYESVMAEDRVRMEDLSLIIKVQSISFFDSVIAKKYTIQNMEKLYKFVQNAKDKLEVYKEKVAFYKRVQARQQKVANEVSK